MNLAATVHIGSHAASTTPTWVAAGAAVLAAITTTVLALVAVLQIRASDRQLAVMRSHVEATSRLARAAEEQAFHDRLKSSGLPFGMPERDIANAVAGIAQTLARAFPPLAVATDDEPSQTAEVSRSVGTNAPS